MDSYELIQDTFWYTATIFDIHFMTSVGADFNIQDTDGNSVLHYAVSHRKSREIIEEIIKNGANINVQNKQNHRPINYAVNNNMPEVIEMFIKYGASIGDIIYQMNYAVWNDMSEVIELLIEHGADINDKVHQIELLELLSVPIEFSTETLTILLNYASIDSIQDALDELSTYKQLHDIQYYEKVFNMLKKAETKCMLNERPISSLFWQHANNAEVKSYFKNNPDINTTNIFGNTYLISAVRYTAFPDVIEQLITLGIDINVKNKYGETALHNAVIYAETPEIISILVKHGADISIRDKRGKTAYDYAICNNSINCTHIINKLKI